VTAIVHPTALARRSDLRCIDGRATPAPELADLNITKSARGAEKRNRARAK